MSRLLIIVGLAIAGLGVAWPLLGRIGLKGIRLGRLPGDILIARGGFRFYAPLGTCLLVSVGLSVLLWLLRR